MKIHQMLAIAQDRYGIVGKDLAKITGIVPQHLSAIRSGRKWVTEDTLEKILEGMDELAPGSREYFCHLLAGKNLKGAQDPAESLKILISVCDSPELYDALDAIAARFREIHKTSKPASACINDLCNV